ncbi:unnamed protein product [Choristocarpus tenellus]
MCSACVIHQHLHSSTHPVWSRRLDKLPLFFKLLMGTYAMFELTPNPSLCLFFYCWITRAMTRYTKALSYAEGTTGHDSDADTAEEDEVTSPSPSEHIAVTVLCNQAACLLKLGDNQAALHAADRALDLCSSWASPVTAKVKSTYRRACALLALTRWDESRKAFRDLLTLDPDNDGARQGLGRLAKAEKAHAQILRKAYGGFFSSSKMKGFASDGREEEEQRSVAAKDKEAQSKGNEFGGHGGESDFEGESWSSDQGSETDTSSEEVGGGGDGDNDIGTEKLGSDTVKNSCGGDLAPPAEPVSP